MINRKANVSVSLYLERLTIMPLFLSTLRKYNPFELSKEAIKLSSLLINRPMMKMMMINTHLISLLFCVWLVNLTEYLIVK